MKARANRVLPAAQQPYRGLVMKNLQGELYQRHRVSRGILDVIRVSPHSTQLRARDTDMYRHGD